MSSNNEPNLLEILFNLCFRLFINFVSNPNLTQSINDTEQLFFAFSKVRRFLEKILKILEYCVNLGIGYFIVEYSFFFFRVKTLFEQANHLPKCQSILLH